MLNRPDDSELVYGLLAALHDSTSIPQFYAKYIRDSRHQTREIGGCVTRANDFLKAEEQKFQDYVTKIIASVRDGLVSLATPADRHRGTLQIVEAWWIQLGDRVDQVAARDAD